MTKPLLALAASAVLLVGLLQSAQAAPSGHAAATGKGKGKGECGLPSKRPLWIDFGDGSVPFWELFAQPGLVSAAANFRYPPQIRAKGGSTIYFDLNFHRRLGSPAKPKPLDEVLESANRLFFYAAASSGCDRPWIALNELFGANLPTPWSATNTVYRANVLAFIKVLAEHGAHVFLLVNSKPYTADEAGDWWREVAKYSDFVREVYFPAPLISKQGPILGNRTMRSAFRDGILELTSAGIPVTKVGLFLGFQTERGNGGREGLERLAWFRTIKWQALAAKQVAAELHVPTLWSWGWGEWGGQSVDPDKPAAACVYLWARNHSLCDGPKVAGPGFNASMAEGQINLPSGVQCIVGGTRLTEGSIRRLVSVTKDRQVAYSALFARTVEGSYADVSGADVRPSSVQSWRRISTAAPPPTGRRWPRRERTSRSRAGSSATSCGRRRSSRASRSRSRAPRRSRPSTTSSGACPPARWEPRRPPGGWGSGRPAWPSPLSPPTRCSR